jgi:putative hydrolase of the HAD superfamily
VTTHRATAIQHVLFDADGVLQDLPGGWYAAMEPYLGPRARDFLHQSWEYELPTLAGQGDFLAMLEAALVDSGVTIPVDEVFRDVWCRIVRVEETVDLVATLRDRGYGVHLATNQEQHRGAYMRTVLGYDDLFDVSCYSYDLRLAKPDPEFFLEAARRIGVERSTILFVDDNAANVEGARAAGLAAVHWDFTQGHPALVEQLARHGIDGLSRWPSSPAS